jgi:hypothetical protein
MVATVPITVPVIATPPVIVAPVPVPTSLFTMFLHGVAALVGVLAVFASLVDPKNFHLSSAGQASGAIAGVVAVVGAAISAALHDTKLTAANNDLLKSWEAKLEPYVTAELGKLPQLVSLVSEALATANEAKSTATEAKTTAVAATSTASEAKGAVSAAADVSALVNSYLATKFGTPEAGPKLVSPVGPAESIPEPSRFAS